MSSKSTLLSDKDLALCKSLSLQDSIEGKRAKALLGLNAGMTMKEAGHESGLTYGQVKYLLQRFRSIGLSLFPASITVKNKTDKKIKVKKKKSKKDKKTMKKKAKKKGKKEEKKKDKKNKKKEKKSKKKK